MVADEAVLASVPSQLDLKSGTRARRMKTNLQ